MSTKLGNGQKYAPTAASFSRSLSLISLRAPAACEVRSPISLKPVSYTHLFFRKTSYRLCPVVRSSKSNSFVSWRSICKESYGNALWTNAILVVSIIPDLGYRRAGLTWGVAVGDVVIIINSCCITRYGKLAYRVGNFLTICIFRQIGEAVGPVIVSCYGLGVCNYAICKKVDGDALWTFAILVVGIVPGFGSGDVEGCWFMSVGDVVAFYLSLIICNCFLSYCVLDFSSCFVLRQVCDCLLYTSVKSYGFQCSVCGLCGYVLGNYASFCLLDVEGALGFVFL